MALSRQHIVQLADKLYERGEHPSMINLRDEIRERTEEKHTSLVEIAHGLRLWREQRFNAHESTENISDKQIANTINHELDRLNTELNSRLTKLIHPYLQHVKQSIADSDDEMVALANLADQLNKKLAQTDEELAQITQERDDLSTIQKAHESELTVLRKQEANQTELLQNYKAENGDLKHKYSELTTTKETQGEQIQNLSAEISQVKNDRTHLQSQLSEQKRLEEKHQKTIEDLQTLKYRAELSCNKAEQNATDTLARFDELGKARDRANHEIDTLKRQLAEAQQHQHEHEKNLAVAENLANERHKEKDRLIVDLKEKSTEVQNLLSTIDQLKSQQSELKNQAETFHSKINAERSRADQLEQQIRVLTTHNEEINKSRQNQESTIKRLEEEIDNLKHKFQERQQLWIKEKRSLTERLESERQLTNEMRVEITKARHAS